jgi:hypothetical protein
MAGVPPKKNTAFTLYTSVVSVADTTIMQANPTIAAGDFQVSIDGGALNNPATLPVVLPAASKQIEIALSAAEMNGDVITIIGSDQAGAEWCDVFIQIFTDTAQISDLEPADVWSYATRTLTASAAAVIAAVLGSSINITRGDSLSASLTGLGDISTRSKLWFTVKRDPETPDTAAIIQIEETDGLVYLNGAAGTAIQGSITVTDAVAGDITIALDEVATAQLAPQACYYDIQVLTAAGAVTTLTDGGAAITADITRATS